MLSKLGNSGRNPENCTRDLRAALGSPPGCQTFLAEIPVRVQKPKRLGRFGAMTASMIPFILPHVFFAWIFDKNRPLFDSMFGLPSMCESFWRGVVERRDPRIAMHPMCKVRHWMQIFCPISIHGDAVPCVQVGKHATKSFDTISWLCLFSQGTTLWVKHLITGIFEHVKTISGSTMDAIWTIVAWSFEALFNGEWPSHDWKGNIYDPLSSEGILAGTPLAAGFRCVIWLLKGDLEHNRKDLKFRGYGANEPCDWCPCHVHGPSPKWWPHYFEDDAEWMSRLFTVLQWRAIHPEGLHILFVRMPYLSHHNVALEELHVLYLGVYMPMLGSAMWCLVYRLMPAGCAETNMQQLWTRISDYYTENSVSTQFSSLNLESFIDPSRPRLQYPSLKGKGAELKDLLGAIADSWRHYKREGNRGDDLVLECLQHLMSIQEIVDDGAKDLFLDKAESNRLIDHARSFLQKYSHLAKAAFDENDCLWSVIPKCHFMWHWADQSKYISPRRAACFIDEDFVGKIKTVVKSVMHGTAAHRASEPVCRKFITAKERWYHCL